MRERHTLRATIDAPWLRHTRERWLAGAAAELRRMALEAVVSSHLPPAFGMTERCVDTLVAARSAEPFIGPDQSAFEAMLAARAAA